MKSYSTLRHTVPSNTSYYILFFFSPNRSQPTKLISPLIKVSGLAVRRPLMGKQEGLFPLKVLLKLCPDQPPCKQNPTVGGHEQRGGRADFVKPLSCRTLRARASRKTPVSVPGRAQGQTEGSLFHSSSACWCWPVSNPAWGRANVQSTLFPEQKHGHTAPEPRPSMSELTYDTQRSALSCPYLGFFFNSPVCLSV